MNSDQKEKTRKHIHSVPTEKLEKGMKQLAHVIKAEHDLGDFAEEAELVELVGLEMDELFWRRMDKLVDKNS